MYYFQILYQLNRLRNFFLSTQALKNRSLMMWLIHQCELCWALDLHARWIRQVENKLLWKFFSHSL